MAQTTSKLDGSQDRPMTVEPAATWTDDEWFADQGGRTVESNDGYWVLADVNCS